MKLLTVSFAVLCLAACACARPRYIAIPVDDIQFLSFGPLPLEDGPVRVARQAGAYSPPSAAYIQEDDADAAASEGRPARQAGHGHHGHHDGHDYVDYGAHTGHHGAFGWYADFPVHAHEH